MPETYLKNTRDQEQRRHSVNHYGNKVKGSTQVQGKRNKGTNIPLLMLWNMV